MARYDSFTARTVAFSAVAILSCTLSACGGEYDCQNKNVQESVYSILREHLYDVTAKSDSAGLQSLNQMHMTFQFQALVLAGRRNNIKADEVDAYNNNIAETEEINKEFVNEVPTKTQFSLSQLFQDSVDATQKTYSCRAQVQMTIPLPSKITSSPEPELKKVLKANFPDGNVKGTVDVGFTVRPELSGNAPFNVQVRW